MQKENQGPQSISGPLTFEAFVNTNMNVKIHKYKYENRQIQIGQCARRIREGQYRGLSPLKHHQSVSALLAIPSFTIHYILITDTHTDTSVQMKMLQDKCTTTKKQKQKAKLINTKRKTSTQIK